MTRSYDSSLMDDDPPCCRHARRSRADACECGDDTCRRAVHIRQRGTDDRTAGLCGNGQRGETAVDVQSDMEAARHITVAREGRERGVPGVIVTARQIRLPVTPWKVRQGPV